MCFCAIIAGYSNPRGGNTCTYSAIMYVLLSHQQYIIICLKKGLDYIGLPDPDISELAVERSVDVIGQTLK